MKRQLKLFFIVLITAVVASALTLFITGNSSILGQKSTSTGDSKFDKLNKAYEQIKSDYYQKTDDDKLVDGAILIVSPIKGSPAEKAGIKPRDQIIKVNGKSVKGMNVNEAVALIRGKKGTKVKLELNRAGVGNIDLSIKRDTIPVETVYSEMKDNNIGEIQITSFSETTAKELTDAIDGLEKKGAKGYILDLRGN